MYSCCCLTSPGLRLGISLGLDLCLGLNVLVLFPSLPEFSKLEISFRSRRLKTLFKSLGLGLDLESLGSSF